MKSQIKNEAVLSEGRNEVYLQGLECTFVTKLWFYTKNPTSMKLKETTTNPLPIPAPYRASHRPVLPFLHGFTSILPQYSSYYGNIMKETKKTACVYSLACSYNVLCLKRALISNQIY